MSWLPLANSTFTNIPSRRKSAGCDPKVKFTNCAASSRPACLTRNLMATMGPLHAL